MAALDGCTLPATGHAAHAARSAFRRVQQGAGGFALNPQYQHNQTGHLVWAHHPAWLIAVSKAVARVTDLAVAVRFLSANVPAASDRDGLVAAWRLSWCSFRRTLKAASARLPAAGYLRSALNTSADALLTSELPLELEGPLLRLAAVSDKPQISLNDGLIAAQNISIVYTQYLEAAILLGVEIKRFGHTRVARARFHGEAANAGFSPELVSQREQRLSHRADVLLWAIERGEGGTHGLGSLQGLSVVELGVNLADMAALLLSACPALQWIGVDCYAEGAPEGKDGPQRRAVAEARLRPWLSTGRARLLISKTMEVDLETLEAPLFDALFVDASHEEGDVAMDLAMWAPRVRPQGIVAGHDYSLLYPGVARAVHAAVPPGAMLHLGPNLVFWWYAL